MLFRGVRPPADDTILLWGPPADRPGPTSDDRPSRSPTSEASSHRANCCGLAAQQVPCDATASDTLEAFPSKGVRLLADATPSSAQEQPVAVPGTTHDDRPSRRPRTAPFQNQLHALANPAPICGTGVGMITKYKKTSSVAIFITACASYRSARPHAIM